VNGAGILLCGNTSLVTVITLGDVTVTPEEKSPQPASGVTMQAAATARAARLPRLRSRSDQDSRPTRPIL